MNSCTSHFRVIATVSFLLTLSFILPVSQAFCAPRLQQQEYSAVSLQCVASDKLRELHALKEEVETSGNLVRGVWSDVSGMWNHLDDVVDDFFYNRMGAGEQWYGKRKYNPSGNYDGAYNGMGRSDHVQIEIARAIREKLELRKQERLSQVQ